MLLRMNGLSWSAFRLDGRSDIIEISKRVSTQKAVRSYDAKGISTTKMGNEDETSSLQEALLPQDGSGNSSQPQEVTPDAPEFSPVRNGTAETNHLSRSFSTDGDDDLPSRAADSESGDPVPRNPYRNPNVLLSFLLCIVGGVADSIWGSVILSAFLLALAKLMGHQSKANTLVGSAEAIQGMTELVSALPIGYVADHVWGKAKVVRLGGVLMIVTIGITLAALWDVQLYAENSQSAAKRSYAMLVVALGMWGIVNGISFGPSQALFSDSIARGRRSELLTWLYACYLLSSAVGPIVSIALTLTVSSEAEDWSIDEIFPVFFIGVCLEMPAAAIMFFFNDKYVVPENDSNDQTEEVGGNHEQQDQDEQQTPDDGERTNEVENAAIENAATGSLEETLLQTEQQDTTTRQTIQRKGKAIIPYVLFISSLVVSLGSGASVKYFPLFFKEMGFSNAEVQGIFLIVPIFISALSFVAQRLGKRCGRVEATIMTNCIGVMLLYGMTWLSQSVGSGDSTLWERRPVQAILVVTIYLFRTGIMNCSYPLLESILMDNVPSNQRARWKALESIASFGWTGSALLGGILSDTHSYQFTFSITATLQLCGGLLLFIIRPFVESETEEDGAQEDSQVEDAEEREVDATVASES